MTCNNCNRCNEVEEVYEEFVPNKEYPVGGFFKIGREVFKVVEHEDCTNCEFCNDINNYNCTRMVCSSTIRCDTNPVVFILFDTLDETEYET